ncbi:MAG: hypothetical protein BWY66_00916 [bacterium ADurb.Bin374]|nr:MAG: hypothetical protein BWY66_00916 [bacterium ADurb.Bin374]
MEFDERRSCFRGSLDLPLIRIDEQAHGDSGFFQPLDGGFHGIEVAGDIETAFRGHFLAPFGNERRHVGFQIHGKFDDLLVHGHFEVEARPDGLAKNLRVPVLYVAPVLAQMDRYAVRPRKFGEGRGPDRIRFTPHSRLADGGNVIDIDSKLYHRIPPDMVLIVIGLLTHDEREETALTPFLTPIGKI